MDATPVTDRANALVQHLVSEHKRYDATVGPGGFALYEPQSSDVIVSSWMKSGTTMMQQMVYQLMCAAGRVADDAEGEKFSDISEVVPYIEPSHKTGWVVPRNPYEPRCFKTHGLPASFDGKQRYIYCFRNARRVAASFFDFAFDWLVPEARSESDEVRAEAFRIWTEQNYLGNRTWFNHCSSWKDASVKGWKVLFIEYEDMCADLEGTVRTVSKFTGVEATDAVVARVASKCSRKNMVGDVRFDDSSISAIMGWISSLGKRVRPADAKSFKDTAESEAMRKGYDELYRVALGVKDFQDLKSVLYGLNSTGS